MKQHGGFKTGEQVDLKYDGKHWIDRYVIVDFQLLKVQLQLYDRKGTPFWASIFHIRKPNIRIGERG